MNPYLIALTLSLATIMSPHAQAEHDVLRRSYETQRTEFTQSYHAQRRTLRHHYLGVREHLLAERATIRRIDCHETRARRLRINSRELGTLAREHGHQNRDLSLAYRNGLQRMREDYDRERRAFRRSTQIRPMAVNRAHPANCGCQACVPPAPAPAYYDHGDDLIDHRQGHRMHDHRRRSRKPNGLEIAVAILNLL